MPASGLRVKETEDPENNWGTMRGHFGWCPSEGDGVGDRVETHRHLGRGGLSEEATKGEFFRQEEQLCKGPEAGIG